MKVIIAGGTGLIGRALTNDLVKDGHEVTILSRNPEQPRKLPGGVQLEKWDGRTSAGWGKLADGADVIVNLAGENLSAGRWNAARKRLIRESRLNAGRAMTQAVQEAAHKPGVLIQASGVGYYGVQADDELSETAPAGVDFLAQLTQDWEDSTRPVEQVGVRRLIIRSGVVLSNENIAFQRLTLPFKLFAGWPVGSGRQWLPWIHIADEVKAIRFLIDTPTANGVFNLCAPSQLRNAQFGKTVAKVLKRPYWMPVPAFAIRLLFGDMAMIVLEGQRAVPAHLQQLGFQFRFPEAETALRDLL